MTPRLLLAAGLCLLLSALSAQDISFGFKAGLNFSRVDGPRENDPSGTQVENFRSATGFHVGATFAYPITDLFGVKVDLMYSQKGVEIDYNGPSYFFLYNPLSGERVQTIAVSERTSELDISNSYIDIPLMLYHRIGILEVEAGASLGYLVTSVGGGGATYGLGSTFGTQTVNYEANFFSDEAGAAGVVARRTDPFTGTGAISPQSIGAYYNNGTDDNLFRRVDFGVVAGLAVYLNSGLYLGGRFNYGLSDITLEDNDVSQSQLGVPAANGDPTFIQRDDYDHNLSIQ
ncbi:MAG: porin family protein, partial [Saprospiraceae bacterium]